MGNTLEPSDLTLTQPALISTDGFFICIGANPTYVFDKENQRTTDRRSGTKAEVVIPDQKYARLGVQLPMGFDELLVPNAKLRFEGFSAKFYKDFRSGEYAITAKADKVIVVK